MVAAEENKAWLCYAIKRIKFDSEKRDGQMSATLEECRAAEKLRIDIYFRSLAGCCWHIVLDDKNIEDSFVQSCTRDAQHPECREIGPLILKMSPTQRRKLASGGYEGK